MADSQQRYRVIEKLESGGMAEVFRAESEGLQGFKKQVAIKRVLPHLSEKKKFISMFLDEARLSAHLSHSNCVQVFDIGVGDNAYFIVMEFVDGANLKAVAEAIRKQGKDFPVSYAAFIALKICEGLSYAHELRDPQGNDLHIVHRDMSPPNVLITKFGEVKIVDFGLAKANSQLEKSEPGIIKGKFSYLSPEAAMGQDVDHRTDIFAVGIILWELLSGQRLFLGETDFQTVKKVQQAVIPPVSQYNKKVTPELERILAKTLARDPNARYQTARELGKDLSRFMFASGMPVSAFEIEGLVQGAMRERQRFKPQQHSIIDKLIEEALFEFTSLKEDDQAPSTESKGPPTDVKAAPLNLGDFEDPSKWLNEIALGQKGGKGGPDPLRASIPDQAFEEGNLSALEDDGTPPPPRGQRHSEPPPSSVRGMPAPPPAGHYAPPGPPATLRGPGPGASGGYPGMTGGPQSGASGGYPAMPPALTPSQPMHGRAHPGMPPQHYPAPGVYGAAPMHAYAPGYAMGAPSSRQPKRSGGSAAFGVVVVIAAAAAVAAAWFTHIIPHN